jgi:hypothetical protein
MGRLPADMWSFWRTGEWMKVLNGGLHCLEDGRCERERELIAPAGCACTCCHAGQGGSGCMMAAIVFLTVNNF